MVDLKHLTRLCSVLDALPAAIVEESNKLQVTNAIIVLEDAREALLIGLALGMSLEHIAERSNEILVKQLNMPRQVANGN